MNVIPFHRMEMFTSLSSEAAEAQLSRSVAYTTNLLSGSSDSGRHFRGNISDGKFRLYRCAGYRNSFQPVVLGQIGAFEGGARIKLHMRPPVLVIVFLAVWWAFALFDLFFTDIWPLAAFIATVGYILMMSAFWFEALKQDKLLRDIFDERYAANVS